MERTNMWNIGYRKIGGIHFIKIGRLFFSFGISRHYRPLQAADRQPINQPEQ
jgi:hypothetical protein